MYWLKMLFSAHALRPASADQEILFSRYASGTGAVKRGQWFRTFDPINAPSVPVLYRLGLVDFANNRGQEPTKYYNVRLTDKGLNALAPENDMTKAPEQHDPRSLNPMKEAVPASSAIHMRVTPDRKKRYVNQARLMD